MGKKDLDIVLKIYNSWGRCPEGLECDECPLHTEVCDCTSNEATEIIAKAYLFDIGYSKDNLLKNKKCIKKASEIIKWIENTDYYFYAMPPYGWWHRELPSFYCEQLGYCEQRLTKELEEKYFWHPEWLEER